MHADSFSSFAPFVDSAIEFANDYPAEFRPAIVQALLTTVRGGTHGASEAGIEAPFESHGTQTLSHIERADPIGRLAAEVDADPSAVRRIVEIDGDGRIHVLVRLRGEGNAQMQNRYSALYCFIREKALRELDTPIDELRALCEKHGWYDSANFTRNFRNGTMVREIGGRGTRDKRYRLSADGEAEARRIFDEHLG